MSVYSNNDMKNIRSNDSWYKITSFVPEGATVLDVGCSSGNLGKALKVMKKTKVIGIDIDKDDIKLAKKVLDDALVIDLEKDALDKLGSFDVIIMADVIEHLVDPVTVLKKLKKVLKKDGRFIFSVPNMANATIRLELLKGRFEYKDFGLLDRTHIHFYDHNEIKRVFHDAGYTIKMTDCTVRVIPDDILVEELQSIGLTASKKFSKHMSEPNASTYQFIGYAIPKKADKNELTIETTTDLDVITQEIDSIRNDFTKKLNEKEKQIHMLTERNYQLDVVLNDIYKSKGWRFLSATHHFIHRIKH